MNDNTDPKRRHYITIIKINVESSLITTEKCNLLIVEAKNQRLCFPNFTKNKIKKKLLYYQSITDLDATKKTTKWKITLWLIKKGPICESVFRTTASQEDPMPLTNRRLGRKQTFSLKTTKRISMPRIEIPGKPTNTKAIHKLQLAISDMVILYRTSAKYRTTFFSLQLLLSSVLKCQKPEDPFRLPLPTGTSR